MNQQEQIAMLRNTLISKGIDPQLIDEALAATSQPAIEAVPVGVAAALAGSNGGFTMCAFSSTDVPNGTKLFTAPPAQEPSNITDAHMVLSELDNLIHDVTGDEGDDDAFKYIRTALAELMAYRGKEPSADALDAKALLNALNSATAYLRPLGHHGAKLPSTKEVRKVLEQIDAAIRQQEGGE